MFGDQWAGSVAEESRGSTAKELRCPYRDPRARQRKSSDDHIGPDLVTVVNRQPGDGTGLKDKSVQLKVEGFQLQTRVFQTPWWGLRCGLTAVMALL